jgi:hypothetical protein
LYIQLTPKRVLIKPMFPMLGEIQDFFEISQP